jgi:hypothetical protein
MRLPPPCSPCCGEGGASIDLLGPDGTVRALVIELDSGLWTQAAQLYEGVQSELELPAPAVSVSGGKTYGLWFSFAVAVPLSRAETFAEGLRQRYLAEVPATRLTLHPRAPLSWCRPTRARADGRPTSTPASAACSSTSPGWRWPRARTSRPNYWRGTQASSPTP